jgi:hypothetical protein
VSGRLGVGPEVFVSSSELSSEDESSLLSPFLLLCVLTHSSLEFL